MCTSRKCRIFLLRGWWTYRCMFPCRIVEFPRIIAEQHVHDPMLQVVEPMIEVPKITSQERILQCTVQQKVDIVLEQEIVSETPEVKGHERMNAVVVSHSGPWHLECHSNWRRVLMADGRGTFWHKLTRQSQWEPPDDEGIHPLQTESEETLMRCPRPSKAISGPSLSVPPIMRGGLCWRGSTCTFAHAYHELHLDVQGS